MTTPGEQPILPVRDAGDPDTDARAAELAQRALGPLTQCALFVDSLQASLPATGSYGAGTRRVITPQLAAWERILTQASAPGLPPPATSETADVVLPEGSAPVTMGADLPALAQLANEQGRALAAWVQSAGAGARARLETIADAFDWLVRAVRTRVADLAEATSDAGVRVRNFLRGFVSGANEALEDLRRTFRQAAFGFGAVLAFALVIALWGRRGR